MQSFPLTGVLDLHTTKFEKLDACFSISQLTIQFKKKKSLHVASTHDTNNNMMSIRASYLFSVYLLPATIMLPRTRHGTASIVVHCTGLFLEEVREPVGRALGVPLQPVAVVHEVYPEPHSEAARPLEVVQERPREVSLHVGAVPAVRDQLHCESDAVTVINSTLIAHLQLNLVVVHSHLMALCRERR